MHQLDKKLTVNYAYAVKYSEIIIAENIQAFSNAFKLHGLSCTGQNSMLPQLQILPISPLTSVSITHTGTSGEAVCCHVEGVMIMVSYISYHSQLNNSLSPFCLIMRKNNHHQKCQMVTLRLYTWGIFVIYTRQLDLLEILSCLLCLAAFFQAQKRRLCWFVGSLTTVWAWGFILRAKWHHHIHKQKAMKVVLIEREWGVGVLRLFLEENSNSSSFCRHSEIIRYTDRWYF